MDWRSYWDGDHPIYVNERHKLLHARMIGRDLAGVVGALMGERNPHVLDHGCGEAAYALELASLCGRLILCDSGPNVRAGLAARTSSEPKITVIAPELLDVGVTDDSLDLVVVNSLLQYVQAPERAALFALWHAKLKPGGTLVVADIIPPDLGPVADARALLGFAWQGGFLIGAVMGLVRTALSDYRKIRGALGLVTYTAAQMSAALREAGFTDITRRPNFGHNPARMAFAAVKPG